MTRYRMLLAGAVLCCAVTPARAMEFTWPSIGSEHETQEQEIDATRTRQAWDHMQQEGQTRDLQDQIDELRAQQRRLQQEHDADE